MKKTMAAVVLAGSLSFLGAGAASAEPLTYPGEETSFTPSDTVVEEGEPVTVTGSGYAPNEDIEITVVRSNSGSTGQSVMATVVMQRTDLIVKADANGDFVAEVQLGDREGTYRITATGLESGVSRSTFVTVVDDDGDDDDWNNDDEDGNGSDGEGNGSDGEGNGNGAGGAGNGTGGGNTAAGPASLANTGLDSGALMLGGAGVLLLGAGATAIIVSRRQVA